MFFECCDCQIDDQNTALCSTDFDELFRINACILQTSYSQIGVGSAEICIFFDFISSKNFKCDYLEVIFYCLFFSIWSTTVTHLNKQHRAQLAIERNITGNRLQDKTQSIEIRALTGTKDICYTIKRLKMKFARDVKCNRDVKKIDSYRL